MNQLRRFMYGRYGFDQLTRALVFASIIVSVITMVTRINVLMLVSYLPLVYAFYRAFSKNIPKRTGENLKYCRMAGAAKTKFQNFKLSVVGTKTHVYFKCSKCKQTIRVPRGKGKICITCPKCKSESIKRT